MIILIADDDRLVRFTIKSMLMEILSWGEHLYLEADNGEELRQICRNHRPDIVFTDIRMPYLNGLEAIEACEKEMPGTEFVVVSGYSEFQYAQKALRLGVNEYLLKPVEEEKLREVMEVLQKKLNKKKRDSNSDFHMKLLNGFNYYAIAGMEEEVEEFSHPAAYSYLGFGLVMRYHPERQKEAMEQHKAFIEKVRMLGETVISRKGYYSMIYSSEGMPCFIFCCDWDKLRDTVNALNRISALAAKGPAFLCTFRFEGNSIREIFQACESIEKNDWIAMNHASGSVIPWEKQWLTEEQRSVLHTTDQLMECWEAADEVAYKEMLHALHCLCRKAEPDLNLGNISACCTYMTEKHISGKNYKEFLRTLEELGRNMHGTFSAEESDIVRQMKNDIQKNYMKDISISQLAEKYNLTANYLSTVFHHKAGCRFVEYLTEVRITHAKKLLLTNLSAAVKDIALMVGYTSARHFSVLFQKQTGMTPSAYRRQAENKDS